MRKILLLRAALCGLLAVTFGIPAFAQELRVSGEVKTGVYWRESQSEGKRKETRVAMGSMDDAGAVDGGNAQGRYRLNLDYNNGNGFGMSARLQTEQWTDKNITWEYAYGWGNFFDNNLTVAIGRLGGSPWGTGGPEKWTELETANGGGMRVEYKPGWVPEQYGKFNVGFVLNWFNDPMEASQGIDDVSLADILQESVIGVSWIHEKFLARFAVRLDSPFDRPRAGADPNKTEGVRMVYRLEEHMLRDLLPGMEMWALGVLTGVGAQDKECVDFSNWLFAQYAPEMFTAQIRFGLDGIHNRTVFNVKPSFYWNFFDKLISAGVSFWYGQDFGSKIYAGSPFQYIELEPKVQINFTSSYIAFVYNWRQEYSGDKEDIDAANGKAPIKQTTRINLRFCIYF